MNTVNLIGCLHADPSISVSRNNNYVFQACIAGTQPVVNRFGAVQVIPFFQHVFCIGRYAELLGDSGLTRGAGVIIEGQLESQLSQAKRRQVKTRILTLTPLQHTPEQTTDTRGGAVMSGGQNDINLVAYLTHHPQLRHNRAGDPVSDLRICWNERRASADTREPSNRPHYFDLYAWRELSDCAQTLRRGDPVMVQGRLIPDNYTDSAGQYRYSVAIEAEKLLPVSRNLKQDAPLAALTLPAALQHTLPSPALSSAF